MSYLFFFRGFITIYKFIEFFVQLFIVYIPTLNPSLKNENTMSVFFSNIYPMYNTICDTITIVE